MTDKKTKRGEILFVLREMTRAILIQARDILNALREQTRAISEQTSAVNRLVSAAADGRVRFQAPFAGTEPRSEGASMGDRFYRATADGISKAGVGWIWGAKMGIQGSDARQARDLIGKVKRLPKLALTSYERAALMRILSRVADDFEKVETDTVGELAESAAIEAYGKTAHRP